MTTNWKAALLRVRAALMRRGRSAHDADDLVQEAWVRLASYEQEHVVAKPEAFLMRAALNLSIDSHRAQVARGEEVVIDDVVLVACNPSAEVRLLARERTDRLIVCVGRLSQKTREIFLAHRFEELTYQEIAQRHQLSISTVEKHIAKATMQLTSWMEGW